MAATTRLKPVKPAVTLAAQSEIIRALYYGDPGKGKSFDLAHMAKLGKVVYIDAEKRLKKGPLQRAGVPLDNIEVRFGVRQDPVTYEGLMALALELKERLADDEPIVGLCWDSASESFRLMLEGLVDSAVASANRAGKERNAWRTYQEDYGDMTEQMRRVIRRFRDLPIHLGISCLSRRDNDEEGAIRVSPALTPAVMRDFIGYMDVVMHCRMEIIGGEEEYSAVTKPIGRFDAKDTFGVLPRVFVTPTFDRLVAYVEGELEAGDDPIQQKAKQARLAEVQVAPAPAPAPEAAASGE